MSNIIVVVIFLCLIPKVAKTTPIASVVKKGSFLQALTMSNNKIIWIVDYGAFNHMTNCHELLTTYTLCVENIKVKIAYGS